MIFLLVGSKPDLILFLWSDLFSLKFMKGGIVNANINRGIQMARSYPFVG
jgi:hypothetical protein